VPFIDPRGDLAVVLDVPRAWVPRILGAACWVVRGGITFRRGFRRVSLLRSCVGGNPFLLVVARAIAGRVANVKKPLGDNSDMECVYEYTSLSRDELRIMKKLLKTNGPLVRLKSMESTPIPATVIKKKRKTAKNDSSDSEVDTPSVHEHESHGTNGSTTSSVSANDSGDDKTLGIEVDTRDKAITEVRELIERMQGLVEMLERL